MFMGNYKTRNNINNLDQIGEVCLDDRLTFDVSVIEIYTNPGRQARSKTLLYYLKLTTTRRPAHYGRAGVSRVSARGRGGGGCFRSGQVR